MSSTSALPTSTETANPTQVLQHWLQDFDKAVTSVGIQSFTELFLPEGWLRDSLIFTWNFRALDGQKAINAFLSHVDNPNSEPNETRFSKAKIGNVKLEPLHGIVPQLAQHGMIEGTFTFETPIFHGNGYVLLVGIPGPSSGVPKEAEGLGGKTWKAFALYLAAADLKGHEESGTPIGYYANHAKTWQEVFEEERKKVEEDPHVVILGAGHNGLNIGARFRQMRIPTLLIDKFDRVGDSWKNRYPSLTLHTLKSHHSMLYTRAPSNWPKFTPRDKVVHMLEQYATNQELVIWNRSTILPNPIYDPVTKRWTIEVDRDGKKITLHPYHIVLAVGMWGPRYMPDLPGANLFKGDHYHAEQFKGPEHYRGKKVIVVGAAQTASDICLDLVLHDAESITMVQRSSTLVTTIDFTNGFLEHTYPMDGDPDAGDLRSNGVPIGLVKKLSIAGREAQVAQYKEMLQGLEKAGLKLHNGVDDGGFIVQLYAAGNKFWVDIGAAEYVINGRIKIKSGEPERFTENGIIFKDGSFLEADAVIFGTGYCPVKHILAPIFGEEISERICPSWGIDEEGEMRRAYRPCGVPGLWWATGGFDTSRRYSKALAIQIKARELGLVNE